MTYEGMEPIEEIRKLDPDPFKWTSTVVPRLARFQPVGQIEV